MQINIDKNLVELTPENGDEIAKLEALWRLMVDCVGFSKKMVPIGEYTPSKNKFARFVIEGEEGGPSAAFPEALADQDCRAYCQTCNKYVELKKGDQIPPCCGKLMDVLDD